MVVTVQMIDPSTKFDPATIINTQNIIHTNLGYTFSPEDGAPHWSPSLATTNGVAINFSVTSDEVPRGRPYPDLIHRAMQLAGVRAPWNVIKVGDTPFDLLEGLAANCGLVVGVTYGTHSRAELERPKVVTIDSLSALLPLAGLGAA